MERFPEIKTRFGFGCMRLPMQGEDVDLAETQRMVDAFLAAGFNYFDTAHGYISGKSETAIRECLAKKYPRESYILTNKLSGSFFKTQADIRPLFEQQLAACGVEYFDFYLMHAQGHTNYGHYKECRAYETALELKAEGKFRHFGISFHDKPELLEQILTEYPEIEIVQIQFNYVDYDDASVQGRRLYEVCEKFNKPIIVMEPVKGGSLVQLPQDAQAVFDELNRQQGTQYSNAAFALRFALDFPLVRMVISGMSDLPQMEDNIGSMKAFRPLNEAEKTAIATARGIYLGEPMIPCTACRYCVDGCPKKILIPDLFSCMNMKMVFRSWNQNYYYNEVHTKNNGKASDCIKCGKCEQICPQHLPIRTLLENVAAEFEKPKDE